MNYIFNRKFFFLSVSTLIVAIPSVVYGAIVTNTNPTSLNDAVQLGVNVSQWILGIVGSLTLLMFVVGGFMLLISAGNAQSVEKGKKIIIGATIGLVIVFCSYMIIKFSMSALGLQWSGSTNAPTAAIVIPNDCLAVYGSQGYTCMDSDYGNSCIPYHCGGDNSLVCCLPN